MYTLRIINQTENGVEKRENIFLGKHYSIILKVPLNNQNIIDGTSKFSLILKQYYKNTFHEEDTLPVENIVGFVYANNCTYPIRDYNVVYIVGNEGQTIERVYGLYEKF